MISLRPATLDDADLLREWRNDPATRAQSFNQHEVTDEEMRAWLVRKVGCIRIAMVDGVPVGQVRIDGGLVSYSVAREHREQGYGREIIRAVMEPLRAEVKPGNTASLRIFRGLGWRESAHADHIEFAYP